MKQHQFYLSHCCQSINHRNHDNLTYNPAIFSLRPRTRCDGTCFQRVPDVYQLKHHPCPSYLYDQMSHSTGQPCSTRPLIACHPSFKYGFHEPCYFEKTESKLKPRNPSSYRVTVRRITPFHVAVGATTAYQTIPSVPGKKLIDKNNGIQLNSTSFITNTNDQESFVGDDVSEKDSERDHFALSKPNSAIANDNVDITTNKNRITEQIESNGNNQVKEQSNNEEFNALKFLSHDTPESTNDSPSIDNSHLPTLPSSLPPNIDHIKSNEALVHVFRSIKSIPSLINEQQKTSTDRIKSNLSLRTARSTLDFGLLIHETSTPHF